MRILHIIPDIAVANGGVGRVVVDLVASLATANQTIDLISLNTTDAECIPVPQSEKNHYFPWSVIGCARRIKLQYLPDFSRQIQQADIVHLHGLWQPANRQIWHLCVKAGRPVVLTTHGMLAPWSVNQKSLKKKLYYYLFERALIFGCDLLHFTANLELEKSKAWIPAQAATVIVPPALFWDEYLTLPDKRDFSKVFPELSHIDRYVLFLGRIHPVKRLDVLISAFADSSADDPSLSLVIAGPGPQEFIRSLMAIAQRRGVGSRVFFLPPVSGMKKMALLRGATLFTSASCQENFGMVFAESLACEVPVLMTTGVDIYPDIQSYNIGFVSGIDELEFSKTFNHVIKNHRHDLAEYGRRGRQWVIENISPSSVACQWIKTYANVISNYEKK